MKRLIRKSNLHGGFSTNDKNYFEVFKNPTSKEIEDAKNQGFYGSIRGVINGNDLYVWSGDILHFLVNGFLSRNKFSELDIYNGLKFHYDPSSLIKWKFDSHGQFSTDEMIEQIKNHENILNDISSISGNIEILAPSEDSASTNVVKIASLKKMARLPVIGDFYKTWEYDFEYLGIQTIQVSDIMGLSSSRVDDYNDDWTHKDKDDTRWNYIYKKFKEGDFIAPIHVTKTPDGKYFVDGDGNHRASVAKVLGIPTLEAMVFEMIPMED